MRWCFGPPAVAPDELAELDTVRKGSGGKTQRLRKSEDSAFETDLVRVASFDVRTQPQDDDWGLSPSRQASFCRCARCSKYCQRVDSVNTARCEVSVATAH